MHESELVPKSASSKTALYQQLEASARTLLIAERDRIANAANLSALLYHALEDVNWLGFYFLRGAELLVGPFQGKPACVRIELGKGVCGAAAERLQTIVVKDVNDFPGHIACDTASQSEIVIPLIRDGILIGVLDVDSPISNRFDQIDRSGLEALAKIFLDLSD